MLISIVIMPVGFVVSGPLSSSTGVTATLVGAAVLGAVPAAVTALVPGNRAVHRTKDGRIVGRPTPQRIIFRSRSHNSERNLP